MSIHVNISEEAQAKLDREKKKSTVISIIVSLVSLCLLGTILAILAITIPQKEVETIISYQAPASDQETTDEPKVRVQQRQMPTPPAASAAVANVITTTSPTSVSIPDTNQMTNIESPDFGSSDDFGMGFGEFGDSSNATFTLFGSTASTGLKDYIFDMKQKSNKQPSKISEIFEGEKNYQAIIRKFQSLRETESIVRNKYSFDSLKNYYRSADELNFTFLAIDSMNAAVGPEAFNAQEDIKPTAWVAVYEGKFA